MTKYYALNEKQLEANTKIPLEILPDTESVNIQLANDMIAVIQQAHKIKEQCVLIVPVGPVSQYPIFVQAVNEKKIDLKNVWFINMDEYLTEEKKHIPTSDRLSFRTFMNREVYDKIDPELIMPEKQRILPSPSAPEQIQNIIDNLGGVTACFGGIGINGHIAFNEPDDVPVEEFLQRPTRVVDISAETRTANSISDLNGALELMPKYAITIGMKEIFQAKKIRLYCFRKWHRSVVRRACCGDVSSAFPVSILQEHPDAKIIINDVAAKSAIE